MSEKLNLELTPSAYRAGGADSEVFIREAVQRNGPRLWKVERRGFVLCKDDLNFEYEPSPSMRDDDFLRRCRFATIDEAASSLRAALELEETLRHL